VAPKERLLRLYDLFPFHDHPLWTRVKEGSLTRDEVLAAERQHFVRTRAGQKLRATAVTQARARSEQILGLLVETYLEECTDQRGPSHLDLIERLLVQGGLKREDVWETRPTPGNAAAIALYRDISSRGVECHMLGAGFVEHYYSQLCPSIFEAYTIRYGMTAEQAETYSIHGPMDATHADRAFQVLDEAIDLLGYDAIELAVRDAFVATSLHYDGMLQGAAGTLTYWDGKP
jgi:pyrroloquinoline quinone (PQQ) biosynthesis protein C